MHTILPYYIATGPVRGPCKHRHRLPARAAECARRDHRRCAKLGGGAYSDRGVYVVTGVPGAYVPRV